MSTEMQTKVQASPVQSFIPVQTGLLQRKYALCNTSGLVEDSERDKEKLTLQRSPADKAEPDTVPPIVHEVLRSPGQPMELTTREFMRSSLGHDFSRVRVHVDARAADSARSINAKAYTVGHHVVFDANEYRPRSSRGRQLIAHELTHILQQRDAPQDSDRQLKLAWGSRFSSLERDAQRIADSVVQLNSERVWGPRVGLEERNQATTFGTVHRAVIQRDQYDYRYPGGIPPVRSRFESTRDACRNRLNWSDGGHWIGTGPEPDCSMRGTAKQTSTITTHWPTEESVIQAREQINRSRNIAGYIVGGLVTIVSAGAKAPLLVALLAGTGGSVLTDYIPSVIDMVRSGDRLTIRLGVAATRSAHPWGRNAFTTSSTWELVDRDGKLKWGMSDRHTIQASDLTQAEFDRLFNALGGQ